MSTTNESAVIRERDGLYALICAIAEGVVTAEQPAPRAVGASHREMRLIVPVAVADQIQDLALRSALGRMPSLTPAGG